MNDQQNTSTQIVTTEGFNAIETRQNAETSAIAMAAKVRANIEAMCIMAERHPRNMLEVRARLLDECRRPGFCDAARYSLPRKKWDEDTRQYVPNNIVGFSIRFAEAALRYLRNIQASSEVVYDDDEKVLVTVTVRDYEMNTSVDDTIIVPKRTEKKRLKKNERPISTRINSFGDPVYIMPASDDEITQKKNALVSKSIRTLVLRLLPGDIQDECEDVIEKTKADKFAKDPLAETKKIMDAFAKIRVMPEQIAAYLGHDPASLAAKELNDLRCVYQAIVDGDISWTEVMDAKVTDGEDDGSQTRNPAIDEARAKAQAKLDAKKNGKPAAAAAAAPTQPATQPAEQTRMREPGED